MDTPTAGNLESILLKLPFEDRGAVVKFIQKQQKTIALHQELIKQINQEMDLNKAVLNAAGDGIVAVDKNHIILDLNPAFAKIFGYTERELKGQNLDALLSENIHSEQPACMPKSGGQTQELFTGDKKENIIHGVHKTEGPKRLSIAISHGLRRGDKIYTGIVRDLTHQHMLERENEKQTEELKSRAKELEGLYHRELEVERISAMGELGTGIAHNVNNGLQAIQAYAQMVIDQVDSEGIKSQLRKIQSKTREIGANVRGILQSSRYERSNGQFEVFDLGELIGDYLTGAENPFKSEALSHGAAITINKRFASDTFIAGAKGEITLVTQALIKNSIDSFLDDGIIDIEVRREGGYVYLQVKDTGVGMSVDAQKKLFEPHSMTNGSEVRKGLSLRTAQKIAHEHGGEITLVESRIGQGTTMELKLPYTEHQEEIRTQEPVRSAQLNILWAEDDFIIQETVKKMAESFEDHIEFVENGQIALDMLKKKHYDLLVTDIGMPVMGGWKLLKSIDGLYENMPRVISSGYIVSPTDMKNSGASHLLNKPLEKTDLIKTLDTIKNTSQASQATSIH